MKKIIFRSIALILIFNHLATICLRDMSFAEEAPPAPAPQASEASTQGTEAGVETTEQQATVEEATPAKTQEASVKAAMMAMSATATPSSGQVAAAGGLNLAVLQSFQNDLFTGKGTFSLPVNVPAGRAGMQPNLAFFYASGSGNGIAGFGWNLELGSIERSTKTGPPKYDSSDKFIFNSGTSQTELVNIGGNEYRAKYEGAFMKFTYNGSYWVVTDKSGSKFYFGQTSSSRLEDGSRIFKWCLDKAIDLKTNYLAVTYQKDLSQIYPQKIEYTGNESTQLAPNFKVEFLLEDRADKLYSYRYGFRVGTAKRLAEVSVKNNSSLVRKYKLSYTNHHTTRVSLLTSVTQYGSDGTTAMPAVKFAYQPELPGWTPIYGSHQLPGAINASIRIFDVNADGLPDIVHYWDYAGIILYKDIYLGNKDLSWQLTSSWSCPVLFGGNSGCDIQGYPYDNGVQIVDVNADGWTDLIKYIQGQSKEVWINNKTGGWNLNSSWTNSLPDEVSFVTYDGCFTQATGWIAADINADGLADLIKAKGSEKSCYINTGSSWSRDSRWDMPEGDFTNGNAQLGDLNADGLVDLFIIDAASSRAYINTGSGWLRDNNFNIDLSAYTEGKGIRLADVNSDGLADILTNDGTLRKTYINSYTDGALATWQEKPEYILPADVNMAAGDVSLSDGKGRFLVDLLIYPWNYLNNNIALPGLLVSVSNGLGGEIQISYKSSIAYDNTGGDGVSDLAFPIYMVDSVRNVDRVDLDKPELVTRYEYKGGVFNAAEREFRGFAYVKATDAEGNYQESYFKQDDIFKGRPYKEEIRDSYGNLYSKAENTWQYTQPYSGVYFAYLAQSDNYTYEGGSSYKQTRATYEYDAYGNPTRVFSVGDVGASGDEKTQITEYAYNTSDWLLSFPKHTYLLDQNSAKVSEKRFYYDNAASIDAAPVKGLLTKEESWLYNPLTTSEQYLAATYAYDQYGNLTSTTDALGRTTTTNYDTIYYTYPLQVTNVLGQTAKTGYYGINESESDLITGSGLLGQVKYQEDSNGIRSYNIYDALGRIVKVIGPNDTEANPGATYEYYFPDNNSVDSYTKLYIPYHSFNGTNEYLAYADSPDWDFSSGNFTIDFWAKFNSLPTYLMGLFEQRENDQNYTICQLYQESGVYYINFRNFKDYGSYTGGFNVITSNLNLSTGTWYHFAFVKSGSSLGIYQDGNCICSGTVWATPGADIPAPFIVGKDDYYGTTTYFDGSINEFRVSKGIARWTQEFTPPKMASPSKVTQRTKTSYQSPYNYLTTYQFYNGLGNALETKAPAEPDPQSGAARQIVSGAVTYNKRGQVEKKYLPVFVNESPDYVKPDYNTPYASFTYDPLGRLTQATNPDGTYSTVNYALWSKTATDENSHYTSEYYDAYGKIIKIEEHNGSQLYTTRYDYDALGNLIKTTDNQNNIVQIWYDSLGRKIKMNDPDMGVWSYEYDAVGNLKKQTDAKGQILEFNYDALNRLTLKKGLSPEGGLSLNLATYTYDETSKNYCVGRLSKITDQSGSTEFFYDKLGREIKSIKTVSGTGSYTVERSYDAIDRLSTLKYPDGEAVTYTYNPQGIEEVKGLSLTYVSNIDYSPTGQLLKIQYGNGTQTSYSYNPNTLRLTNLTTQSPSGKIQDLNYSFDNVGNIAQLTDYVNTATQSFNYDDLNRLIQAQGSYGSFTYAYDSIGNMTSKEGVSLIYGKLGKLPHAVTQYGSTLIDYDSNGNMIKKDGLELTYDAENRLTQAQDASSASALTLAFTLKPGWNFFSLPVAPADLSVAAVLSSISGKYDQVSRYNSTSKTFEHYCGNANYNQFDTLEYGRGYQIYITSATDVNLSITGTIPTTAVLPLKAGYNLISCVKTSEAAVEQALLPLQLGVDYSKVLHYNKQSSLFEIYDSSQQAFSALKPGESYYLYCLKDTTWNITNAKPATSFLYDGDGGRVKKTVGASSTTYIGSLYEVESDGSTTKHIFAGANRVVSAKKLSPQETVSELSYYHSDHLGSSNVITDATGAQAGLTEFTPYGSTFKQTGTYDPRHKFTGKELDASTGLYFYGARYYDPQLGRFTTPDSIVQSPYSPQTLNRYSYCSNNPINYVDPTGHSWKSFWKKFGDWVSPLGRAIVTGDWAHFGFQMLNMIGLTVGVMTGNPWLIASSALSYASLATSDMPGRTWGNVSRGMGYAAATIAVAGTVYEIGSGIKNWMQQGGQSSASPQTGQGNWEYGGTLMSEDTSQSTSVYGQKRAWVGYSEDQLATLKTSRSDIYVDYVTNKNINFVENPSWGDFKGALTSKYDLVALHTHGGPPGLEFAGRSYHGLWELSNIEMSINAKTLAVSSCYPQVQSSAWSSLKVSTTNYIDLSATANHAPRSNRLQGIENVYNEVKKY